MALPAVLRALPGAATRVPGKAAGIPDDIQAIITKAADFLRDMEQASKTVAKTAREEQKRRVGAAFGTEGIQAQLGPATADNPFGFFRQTLGSLAGELGTPNTLGPGFAKSTLTDADMAKLMNYAMKFQGSSTEVLNNQRAVWTVFDLNSIPQPDMIARLNTMFGEDFSGQLARISRTDGDLGDFALNVLNIPRTLMATADLSAATRQARVLGQGNPKEWKDAIAASVKSLGSESSARAVESNIIRHPNYDWIQAGGIEITQRGPGAALVTREEPFLTNLAQSLPYIGRGVRASERAHVTLLNKLRSDVAYKTADDWIKAGRKLDDEKTLKEWKQYGEWINAATGRGAIPDTPT